MKSADTYNPGYASLIVMGAMSLSSGGIVQGLNFTAIDFETANSNRGSVCAVGLTKVQSGAVVDSKSWLIKPPASIGHFDPRNVSVHGIQASDVVRATKWEASLDRILAFAGSDVLVAHNASFDRSVLRNACTESGFKPPELTFHCSVDLAKRVLELDNNRLPTVAKALGLAPFQHHHAGDDSAVCAQAVIAVARTRSLHTLDELWPMRRPTASASSAQYQRTPALAELPQPNLAADPTHPLYGQVVVFTGELVTLERGEVMELVARAGAINGKNITKKTTMLVIGRQDASAGLVAISNKSGKERKAAQYIEAGRCIRAVSEKELLGWLQLRAKTPRQKPADVSTPLPEPVLADQGNSALEATAGKLGTVVLGILKWAGSNRR